MAEKKAICVFYLIIKPAPNNFKGNQPASQQATQHSAAITNCVSLSAWGRRMKCVWPHEVIFRLNSNNFLSTLCPFNLLLN